MLSDKLYGKDDPVKTDRMTFVAFPQSRPKSLENNKILKCNHWCNGDKIMCL